MLGCGDGKCYGSCEVHGRCCVNKLNLTTQANSETTLTIASCGPASSLNFHEVIYEQAHVALLEVQMM
jgi:hypothetical protein